MKNIFLIGIVSLLIVVSCGENNPYNPTPDPSVDSVSYGTDATLDIMTWNIQNYPKAGYTTNNLVARIIKTLKVDLLHFKKLNQMHIFNCF